VIGMRRLGTTEYRKSEKARILADVETYLKSGKTITLIPPGVSGEEPIGITEHQRENENCKKQAEIQNPDVPEADQVIYLSPEAAWNSAIEDQEGADGDYWSS